MTRSLTTLVWWCLGIAAAAALALGIGNPPAGAQDRAAPTLAVLPFANSSGDAAQDFVLCFGKSR